MAGFALTLEVSYIVKALIIGVVAFLFCSWSGLFRYIGTKIFDWFMKGEP
jgi:hypothetical protein